MVANAGYGSEQNYEYIEKEKITEYVKCNYFHMEQKKKFRDNIFLARNLFYNLDANFIICPMGQHMDFVYRKKNKSELGYESEVSVYKALDCQGCPLRCKCHNVRGNTAIGLNHKSLEYKKKVRELLMSEEGMVHRSKRLVISLYAKGLSVSDIEDELRDISRINLSTSAISIITNKVIFHSKRLSTVGTGD